MILKAHSDASYLSESQARSRAGEFFYMGDAMADIRQPNRAVMVLSTIIRNIMLLEAKSECGAFFYYAK